MYQEGVIKTLFRLSIQVEFHFYIKVLKFRYRKGGKLYSVTFVYMFLKMLLNEMVFHSVNFLLQKNGIFQCMEFLLINFFRDAPDYFSYGLGPRCYAKYVFMVID